MKTSVRCIGVAALLLAPPLAAQPSQFGLWSAAELAKRNAALSTKVGPDHSSRETLADYGHHRFRLLYRDADGAPEQHDTIVDVVMVQSGEGTLQLGGEMIGRRAGSGAGEFVGTRLEGGTRHPLGAGDVLHIPAGIPHSFLVPKGKQITYVLVKFPKD
jgi:quercetin dioxygenase-like cupin family protein